MSRVKATLDVVSTVAIVVMCATVAWFTYIDHVGTGKRPPVSSQAPPPYRPTAGGPAVPAVPKEPVDISDVTSLGSRSAKVAIVEFADFQCPFCAAFARDTLPQLKKQYVDPGRVLLTFRHLPIASHAEARPAAAAAACAAAQGKFWELQDRLFNSPGALNTLTLKTSASGLGLNQAAYDSCMATSGPAAVERDVAEAKRLGVSGTPTFLVGPILADGRVKVTAVFQGAKPLSQFSSTIDFLLSSSLVKSGN